MAKTKYSRILKPWFSN